MHYLNNQKEESEEEYKKSILILLFQKVVNMYLYNFFVFVLKHE